MFSRFGRLSILVLNAGHVETQDLGHLSENEFYMQFTVSAKVPLFIVHAAAQDSQEGASSTSSVQHLTQT